MGDNLWVILSGTALVSLLNLVPGLLWYTGRIPGRGMELYRLLALIPMGIAGLCIAAALGIFVLGERWREIEPLAEVVAQGLVWIGVAVGVGGWIGATAEADWLKPRRLRDGDREED